MEAGPMRERITILSPSPEQDKYGGPTGVYNELFTTWAEFLPMLGREMFAAKAVESHVEVKFRLRYRAGVQNDYRVLHEGIQYDILSAVNVSGRNRELLLYCKQVIPNG